MAGVGIGHCIINGWVIINIVIEWVGWEFLEDWDSLLDVSR